MACMLRCMLRCLCVHAQMFVCVCAQAGEAQEFPRGEHKEIDHDAKEERPQRRKEI